MNTQSAAEFPSDSQKPGWAQWTLDRAGKSAAVLKEMLKYIPKLLLKKKPVAEKPENRCETSVSKDDAVQRFQEVMFNILSNIPASNEPAAEKPKDRCGTIKYKAATQAAIVSGTLAIPAGPLGLLTIVPDLIGIWKIQSQMVSDIAAVYGKTACLKPENMVYCLFRHAAGHIVRDLLVKAGERLVVRRVSLRFIQQLLQKIGIQILQRTAGRAFIRWFPILGSVGMAGFSFWDTTRVADTAVDLFSKLEAKEKSKRKEKSPAARVVEIDAQVVSAPVSSKPADAVRKRKKRATGQKARRAKIKGKKATSPVGEK